MVFKNATDKISGQVGYSNETIIALKIIFYPLIQSEEALKKLEKFQKAFYFNLKILFLKVILAQWCFNMIDLNVVNFKIQI